LIWPVTLNVGVVAVGVVAVAVVAVVGVVAVVDVVPGAAVGAGNGPFADAASETDVAVICVAHVPEPITCAYTPVLRVWPFRFVCVAELVTTFR
jgi:hypothetical protein